MEKTSLLGQLLQECRAMASYALTSGLPVPQAAVLAVEAFPASQNADADACLAAGEIGNLVSAHQQLSQIVAPATPRSILYLEVQSRSKTLRFLGAVPLMRSMLLAAVGCLVVFIGLSMSDDINLKNQAKSIFDFSGLPLLINETFLLAAAGIGATFAILFELNRLVARATFDPIRSSYYWVQFALGLIAGIVLAELIPSIFDKDSALQTLTKPVLAMLGGFSASAVYRILHRLVDTVESLVRGDTSDMIEAQAQTSRAQAYQRLVASRLGLAADIMRFHQQIGPETTPDEIKQMLNQLLAGLLPAGKINCPEPQSSVPDAPGALEKDQ